MCNPRQGASADPHKGGSSGFCLYEIHSRRRVLMTPPNMFAQDGEWSRDGLQIFFTGSDPARRPSLYRIFWDGTGLQKYASGGGVVLWPYVGVAIDQQDGRRLKGFP